MVSSAVCWWADVAGVAWASGDAACWWVDGAWVVCWAGAACSAGADGAWAGSSLMAASSASIWALNWVASSEAPTSWQEPLG